MSGPLRLVVHAEGAAQEAARACEADVFLSRFGNTRQMLDEEYGPYEDASIFLAALDEDGTAQAMARVIRPGAAGLKTLQDLRRDPWRLDPAEVAAEAGLDLSRTWDYATVAVRPESRRFGVPIFPTVDRAAHYTAFANGATDMLAVLDEAVRTRLARNGPSYPLLPGTRPGPYLGSPASSPIRVRVPDWLMRRAWLATPDPAVRPPWLSAPGIEVPDPTAFLIERVVDLRGFDAPAPGAPAAHPQGGGARRAG